MRVWILEDSAETGSGKVMLFWSKLRSGFRESDGKIQLTNIHRNTSSPLPTLSYQGSKSVTHHGSSENHIWLKVP